MWRVGELAKRRQPLLWKLLKISKLRLDVIEARLLARSMRCLILSAALGVALAGSVRAGDFKLPDENPVASFTIPGSWKPAEYEDGVEAASDDGSVYIAIEAADLSSEDDISSAMTASINYLGQKGSHVGLRLGQTNQRQNQWHGRRSCRLEG